MEDRKRLRNPVSSHGNKGVSKNKERHSKKMDDKSAFLRRAVTQTRNFAKQSRALIQIATGKTYAYVLGKQQSLRGRGDLDSRRYGHEPESDSKD